METRKIILRQPELKDYSVLFKWRNSLRFRNLFHYSTAEISYDGFLKEFARNTKTRHCQFVIEYKMTETMIGIVFSHTFSVVNGYCFINLYIDEPFELKGYGIVAFSLFFCHLFDSYPLHKIYFEVFEYNKLSLSTLQSAGFALEGRFKEHKFYNGTRHDVLRFAAYRGNLPRFRNIVTRFSI